MHMDPGVLPIDLRTLLWRLPAALGVLAMVLHARRYVGWTRAVVAGSGFVAGLAAGTMAVHGIAGALAGALGGWAVAVAAMGTPFPWAYAATRTLLLVVGVGRVGCLVIGCCFGTPSGLPWAVSHPAGSLAHELHSALGWTWDGLPSLPVHPVPAYECAALLLAAAALPAIRKRVGNDRGLALWVAAGYLALRAAVDPLRGMINTPGSLDPLGPLTMAQWAYLGAAVVLAVAAWLLPRPRTASALPLPAARARTLAAWICATAAFAATHASLPPFPLLMGIVMLAAGGTLLAAGAVGEVTGTRRLEALVAAAGLLLLLPAGLRASSGADDGRYWVYAVDEDGERLVRIGDQSTPPEEMERVGAPDLVPADEEPAPGTKPAEPWRPHPTLPAKPVPVPEPAPAPATDEEPSRGLRFSFHGGGGYLQHSHSSCSGPTHIYSHASFVAGASIGQEEQPSEEFGESWRVTAGVLGDRWEHRVEDGSYTKTNESGLDLMGFVGGMYHWDWEWVGLGLGGMFGAGRAEGPDPYFIPLGSWGFAMPGAYLRIGPPVFAYETGTQSLDRIWPGTFGGFRTIIEGHELRFGVEIPRLAYPMGNMTFYLDGRLRLTKLLGLQLHLGIPVTGHAATGAMGWSFTF
jgi:prolipoprotein diacylglyceryltransferase